jgi:SAM-dependent methyltransferase
VRIPPPHELDLGALTDGAPLEAFDDQQFRDAYSQGVEHHFWNLARNKIVYRTLVEHPSIKNDPSALILDVGCGPGLTVLYLRQHRLDCWGCDLGDPPVCAEVRNHVFVATPFSNLPAEFRGRVRAVLLLDVLEHVNTPADFLHKIVAEFPGLALLVVTVPARAELWSNYDEYYGHRRRFSRGALEELLSGAGLRTETMRYMFAALYPIVRLVLRLKRGRPVDIRPPAMARMHRLAATYFAWEARWVPGVIPGTSLLAVTTPTGSPYPKGEAVTRA